MKECKCNVLVFNEDYKEWYCNDCKKLVVSTDNHHTKTKHIIDFTMLFYPVRWKMFKRDIFKENYKGRG